MHVKFLCPCAYDAVTTPTPRALPSVIQPGAAQDTLYFCTDCNQLRCNDCIWWETSTCYCPHCLFEVPSTSLQAQKARCARSCFTCPLCTHILSVLGSDPPRGTPLLSAEASQGQAPFYFACTACQWDSKRLGIVADKPAELHSDILAAEKPSPQQRTFDQLRVHLAPEIKKNMQWHAALTDTDARPSMPKVLADMPHLSHYVHGSRSVHNFPASTQKVPRVMEFDTPRQAARMAKRREFVAQRHAADGGPRGITDMAQRRSMPWEQPYETSLLWPQRVKLVAKHTKKCQVCAHTLIRPEQRVSSARYRTKELAMHYLPSMHVSRRNDYLLLTLVNPHKDAMQVRLASKLEMSTDAIEIPPSTGSVARIVPAGDPFAAHVLHDANTATIGIRGSLLDACAVRVEWHTIAAPHAFWAILPQYYDRLWS